MQKIACVFSFQLSSWVSCQKIVFNLLKSYQLKSDLELLKFNYPVEQEQHDIHKTARDIFEAKPDIISILDHKPHPFDLLRHLLPLYTDPYKKPKIIIHVFGDFTLYYWNWENTQQLLKGFQVEFIVASDRQKILIDRFLAPHLKAKICPFPVDPLEFNYHPDLRAPQRKAWGLKENDFAFVYTGRLTRQKHTHTLIKIFAEALKITESKKAHLFLYGYTDHIGDPFVGKWETEGEYFRKIFRIYRELPSEIQARIHFMGGVPNKELKSVYQAVDCLLNLSIHNDEDYGMSVAEAQASGLPAILTDWGGLASFCYAELPEATTYVPVSFGAKSKLISISHAIEAMVMVIQRGVDLSNRQKLSELALAKFSVEAGLRAITPALEEPCPKFQGFGPFFMKVIDRFRFFPNNVYLSPKQNLTSLYKEIYSAYVRTSK
jgi:glycosyltransferase involved in cell wall biosynthesis